MASALELEAPARASRAEMYCRTPSNAEGQSAEFELQFKMLEPDLAALTSGAFNGDGRASAGSRAGRDLATVTGCCAPSIGVSRNSGGNFPRRVYFCVRRDRQPSAARPSRAGSSVVGSGTATTLLPRLRPPRVSTPRVEPLSDDPPLASEFEELSAAAPNGSFGSREPAKPSPLD